MIRVVAVTFRDGTSQKDRQATLDAVQGRVVGGWRFAGIAEGIYAVLFPNVHDVVALQRIIDQLRIMPHVVRATPVI